MVLTKQHLRYEEVGQCNCVVSSGCNVCCCSKSVCATATSADITIWDMKLREKKMVLKGSDDLVTRIAVCFKRASLVAGFADGSIRIYKVLQGDSESSVVLSGHKSPVSSLAFSSDGLLLASGGKDSALIVWDLVNESGRFRLIGHKGPLTQAKFCQQDKFLISSSKDSFLKIWDLSCQHALWTITDHRTEVWDFVFLQEETCLVTGSGEQELRVYKLEWTHGQKATQDTNEQSTDVVSCQLIGNVLRNCKGRVCQLTVTPDQRLLACLGTSSAFDIFRIFTVEEMERRKKKKLRKLKKDRNCDEETVDATLLGIVGSDVSLRLVRIGEHRTESKSKIKSVDATPSSTFESTTFMCSLSTNEMEVVNVMANESALETNAHLVLDQCGHRSDMRAVCFSHDNGGILSASDDSIRLWSVASMKCVRAINTNKAISALFAPGDRHALIGNKAGEIVLYDLNAAQVVQTYEAHGGTVWALALSPDMTMVASASADKTVKMWTFELNSVAERSELSLRHTRTLELSEDALCVKFSHNSKYIAVGLLDNTAKIFFADTFKLFLTLYGHSLPVLCLDISSDNALIATGAADKNIKIWGMDFGDCHKSLFAHDDSVTCINFIPGTHLFFSSGKDGLIKQWDADKFERIQSLKGHKGEVWCIGLSDTGAQLVSCSHDKTLRVWDRTDEVLVVQEEQEEERAKDQENALLDAEDVIPGESVVESDIAAKKTMDSVRSAESIIECVEIIDSEKAAIFEDPKYKLSHPMINVLGSATLERFAVDVLRKIKPNDLEKALLLVPFSHIVKLLPVLCDAIRLHYYSEQACKVLLFILRVHHTQLISTPQVMSTIDKLRNVVPSAVKDTLDLFGFNLAGLRLIQLELAEREHVQLFKEAIESATKKKKRKKQAFVLSL